LRERRMSMDMRVGGVPLARCRDSGNENARGLSGTRAHLSARK